MRKLKQIAILLVGALLCIGCSTIPSTSYNPWQVINLPSEATFSDLAFTKDPLHGWMVGTKATIFETTDGGNTWKEKAIDLGTEKIAFTGVSFKDQEGWIVGQPSILLHTDDGGKSWSRIPLSDKLPGAPYDIIALSPSSAEMVTDLGAIYQTKRRRSQLASFGRRSYRCSTEYFSFRRWGIHCCFSERQFLLDLETRSEGMGTPSAHFFPQAPEYGVWQRWKKLAHRSRRSNPVF